LTDINADRDKTLMASAIVRFIPVNPFWYKDLPDAAAPQTSLKVNYWPDVDESSSPSGTLIRADIE